MVSAGDIAGKAAGMFGSAGNILPFVIKFLFVGGIVGTAFYFVMKWLKYRTEVEIYSPRAGEGVKIFKDRGGFIKKKRGQGKTFKLLKRKAEAPFVELKHVFSQGKKSYIKLYETNLGEYVPLNLHLDKKESELEMSPEDLDVQMYRDQKFLRNRQQWDKKSKLEQWMPVLLIAVPTVLMIVLFYIVGKDMISISANFNNAMASLKTAIASGGPPA